MEQKKFDFNSFIGMLLLGGILFWWMNSSKPETTETTTTPTEQTSTQAAATTEDTTAILNDSLRQIALNNKLGAFSYGAMRAKEGVTSIENEVLKLTIDHKGGQIVEALIKNYKTYDSLPLYLIKDKNATFNINFGTTDNRVLNTQDVVFEAQKTKNGENEVLTLKLKVAEDKFLEYRYEMKPNDYRVGFAVRSQGLGNVINASQQINLDWKLNAFRNEKSMKTENTMYSWLYYKTEGDVEYLRPGNSEVANDLSWVSYKQHFFSSILRSETPFNNATVTSTDLVKDKEKDTVFTKAYELKAPLALNNGELNYNMEWFYGPTDYNLLKTFKGTDLDQTADLGWGIFGTLNRWVFYPVFNVLKGFVGNYGLIIILMTIVVRILLSPVLYKSYLSSAKMKVIRPEMEEINKKYPGNENALKRQQEIMAVQRKAGVSMMSGCIPALLQMPVFFALFKFFPTNIDFRQKSFLWANDLSSYDIIFKLPFNIPFYGDHVSLFPILASIAIFFYMRMNQSQQANMQAPPQEGMPDMSKMMKWMIYFSPIMMLFFFNNYASGLSLYYFISNLLTITIMFVIKNYVIDEAKIHAQIEANKKKPVKKSKFRERLDAAMKQAQEQQAAQQKTKNKK
ncbi:Membrane protein insertase YidC [Tenacibaculum litopenaei]|uniref:membrane protein insertase YidC n=1 Tax=Tenacibaculum litopenaei TaxID=396016 RepID=UPI00389493C7